GPAAAGQVDGRGNAPAATEPTGTTRVAGRAGASDGRNQRTQMRPRGWPWGDTQLGWPGSRWATTIVQEPSSSYTTWLPLIVTGLYSSLALWRNWFLRQQ